MNAISRLASGAPVNLKPRPPLPQGVIEIFSVSVQQQLNEWNARCAEVDKENAEIIARAIALAVQDLQRTIRQTE